MPSRYLEHFEPRQRFGGAARIRIEKNRIMTVAAEFDPQPFHLDEQAASSSIVQGLVASGWHTCSPTATPRRERFEARKRHLGAGFDDFAGRALCGRTTSCA
jgi:hypothetical protein